MLEYAAIGGVVFLAALAAGGALFMASGLFHSRNSSPAPQAEIAGLAAELRNAREKIQDLSEEKRGQAAQLEAVTEERNALREQIVQGAEAAKNLEQRLADLKDAKEQMRQEFGNIANALMKSHGETFERRNKDQLNNLLTPFKAQIEKFEKQVASANRDSLAQHVALKEQLKMLSEHSARASRETQDLTRALKGNAQAQGAWGEMVLETILQKSGLRKDEEYTSQQTHADEDGGRPRTDYIVNLPNGEKIIIDAKVSLKDFEAFVNAENEETRAARLAGHAASVKSHIRTLAGKEYHAKVGGKLDFVILFMPIESALGAAFERDAEIGYYAADNKVTLATPTTLTIALKTVAAIWRVERQNRNAAEIAQRAGKLYDKFVGFLGDMGEIGDRLRQAGAAYDGAMNKLSQGRGNLVGQVEKLKNMGAETNKSIPITYLDDASEPAAAPGRNETAGEEAGPEEEDPNGASAPAPRPVRLLAP